MKKTSFYLVLTLLSVISFHYCKIVYGRPKLFQPQEVYELKIYHSGPLSFLLKVAYNSENIILAEIIKQASNE
jgi:hypothetical protein